MASAKIHVHQLTSNAQDNHAAITNALRILRPHLPISIPLYRRLQFGRFFESSVLLTSIDITVQPMPKDRPWILAFVDRSCRPETEVWIFASWESELENVIRSNSRYATVSLAHDWQGASPEDQKNASWLIALVKAIKDLGPLPESIHQEQLATRANDHERDVSGTSRTEYSAHMLNPDLILFGAVHSSTTRLLAKYGSLKHVFENNEPLIPNWTYVFDVSNLPSAVAEIELPNELEWGELKREDLALVRSRTQIPRQERTLAELPSVAIVEKRSGKLVAWVFVGLDGSLTSLHVEEEWRGRKLGMLLAIQLWHMSTGCMQRFWEQSVTPWAHDYVIHGNVASKKVSERLGGKYIGDTYWVRVHLGAV